MAGNGDLDTSLFNSDERACLNELLEVIQMEKQSPQRSIAPNSPNSQMNNLSQSVSPAPVQHSMKQNHKSALPFLKIVEQPASKSLRFRYECEGRSAGSIPGVNSTPENKTYPTIEIVNYDKKAIVILSCVTKDPPYRPHPHKVVGRGVGQKYIDGYCEVELEGPTLRAVFSNLGIQCVKRREVLNSLELRKKKQINPFNVPYASADQRPTYDLNVVRLCFQAFINPTGNRWEPLAAQISDPIYDKKGVFDLKICQLCSCSGKVNGGDRIILLCEKVKTKDIKIKFSECNNEGELTWAAYADFQQSDIHKQTAIVFRTPRYERTDITDAVKVYIQLERPSDGGLSEPLEFEYYPDPDSFKRKRFRPDKFKEEISALRTNLQGNGLLLGDINGQYQVPSITTTVKDLEPPANAYTMPQFKTEPAPSPDYYTKQYSPCSVTYSPIPQASPTGAGLQYTSLQPLQNMNQFLTPFNPLPTTSGGSVSLIYNDHTTGQNPSSSISFEPNIPVQMNGDALMSINSDERIIQTICNLLSNSSELPNLPEPEVGLTESGLLNELAGEQLMEIANLSVSGET